MSNTDLRDNIVRLLEEVVERANYINHRHPEKQDLSLDIDLVKDDLRSLYRHFELLKNVNGATPGRQEGVSKKPATAPPASDVSSAGGPSPEKEEEVPMSKPEEPMSKPEEPVAKPEEPVAKPEEPVAKPEEPVAKPEEPVSGPVDRTGETPAGKPSGLHSNRPVDRPEENPAGKQTYPRPGDPRPGDPSPGNNKAVIDLLSEYAGRTIGDQYIEEDNSVHQRISNQKEDKSIGARMQQNPIASLKEAIGVNEKFLFINELFKGNIQAYNEAISRLNAMDDAKAAFDYLNELSMIHSWDANRSASTIEKLADLVHRRHMSK